MRNWHAFWNGVRTAARNAPILGHLAHCTKKNHWDALKEFSINFVFGTATFWLTALLLSAFASNKGLNYFGILFLTMSAGQLFIFSVGMLGPILLTASDDPSDEAKFPGRPSHFTVLIIIGALASGFYAMSLASKNGSKEIFDNDFLFHASLVIGIVATVMRYLTTVYRKSTLKFDLEDKFKKPVSDFADQFARRHGGETE
jgi:hypothetical protein